MTTVLIVEDDPKIRANLLFQLRDEDVEATAVESAEEAHSVIRAADSTPPDLLLLDVRLPGMSGVDLVRSLVQTSCLPPTIIISGEASISETVEALRLGVHDFIEKPFSAERLAQSIRNTLAHSALEQRVAELQSELSGSTEILGASQVMQQLRHHIAQAAPTDGRVLIRGDSGTGKELVADALHRQSPRRESPFIKINCAAIPSHLIEDELFGHVRGAFTDARADKAGLFEEADGGTLFLDEIGDMDFQLQSRLLRVLEDGRVRRIGDTRDREVNVRVIAATHTDLEASIADKIFREDLFFRLAHLPIEVPPLRDRGSDVRLLFDHFIRHSWRRHRMRPRRVEEDVYPVLEAYAWPGNVRELRNVCERLVVFGADPVTVEQLPAQIRSPVRPAEATVLAPEVGGPAMSLRDFRAKAEREYLDRVLRGTGWNVAAAARLLDIQRTHLHHKIAALGLHRPAATPGRGQRPS